ncbi:MAG: FHA domain-containing protein [Planctomycetes bacterium]|nr:FHA domain-containing protein [Planctomycetota bacterium]
MPGDHASRAPPAVVVLQGENVGRRYEIPESGALVVGRRPDCEIAIPDLSISGRHCRLEVRATGVELVDLGSKNGSRVNGVPVANRVLADGDRIRIGDTVFRFEEGRTGPRAKVVQDVPATIGPETYSVPAGKKADTDRILRTHTASDADANDVLMAWRILYEFATVSARTQDPAEVIRSCLEGVVEAVGADRACLVLKPREEGGDLRVEFVVDRLGEDEPFPVSRTIVRHSIDRGEAVLTLDRSASEMFKDAKSLVDQGVQSVMCVPLETDTGPAGALYVDSVRKMGVFRPGTLRALAGLSRLVGLTLEKHTLGERIRRAENQLAAIDANAPVAILGLDAAGRISRWSDHAARLFGHAGTETIGRMEFRSLFASPGVAARILSQVRSRGTFEEEFAAVTKDGKPLAIFARFVHLDPSEGSPFDVAGYLVDVTERRRLLSYAVQQEKMAGLGLILAGVSHDLGKLVGQIHNLCQLQGQASDPGEAMERVGEFADQARELLTSLMDFARRSTKKELADPVAVVESVRKMTATDLRISKVRVETDFAPCPPVLANVGFLKDVLLNLIVNARQAMPGGGSIRLIARPKNGGVEIVLEDTGVGISPEKIESLFEPFFTERAHGDTEQGTGLGLFMAKQVIEEHSGTIRVESEVGKGTAVVIELPGASRETPTRRDLMTDTRDA